jgi:hypothetical protein
MEVGRAGRRVGAMGASRLGRWGGGRKGVVERKE